MFEGVCMIGLLKAKLLCWQMGNHLQNMMVEVETACYLANQLFNVKKPALKLSILQPLLSQPSPPYQHLSTLPCLQIKCPTMLPPRRVFSANTQLRWSPPLPCAAAQLPGAAHVAATAHGLAGNDQPSQALHPVGNGKKDVFFCCLGI